MASKLDELKREYKRQEEEETDRYFEELSKGLKDPSCKINEIEQMMIENRQRMDTLFSRITSAALSEVEIDNKKNVPNAGEACDG